MAALAKQSSLDEKDTSSTSSVQAINEKVGVDVAVNLLVGHDQDAAIDPAEYARVKRKLDWHLLPLLFIIYCVQFIDKGTLGSVAVLGFIQDNKLSQDQFNTLGSAFYIGFLVFEYPQNWALQRFPVGKWLTFNIALWALFLGLHPLCKNFSSLFVLRFLLGASEGCITAGLMLIIGMFYTRTEIGERIGWTFQCNGFAQIIGGFIQFGAYHVHPRGKPNQWQTLFIVTTGITVVVAVLFYFYFPDNPTTAWFLTEEEKLVAVKRVQSNQNGIETKKWKKYQFIEALKDEKTWLFFLFAAVSDLQNGIAVQYGLLIKSFGFTTLQTTLLNIPSGVSQVIAITLACFILRKCPNSRGYIGVLFFFPSILAVVLQMTLPISNKVGHLCALYVQNFGGSPSFVMCISWVTSTVAGHTKRTTTNGIFLIGYALGQILCTQFWRAKYAPTNRVPWGICLATYVVDIALLLLIRYRLDAENKRRDALQGKTDQDDLGYLEIEDANGKLVKVRVEKAMLDLTDKENLAFRYVL